MIPNVVEPAYLLTAQRLGLALAIGLLVGLERERRGKEAGLRTFGFAALIGGLGGLLGEGYAMLSIGSLLVLIIFLNLQALRSDETTELTTSAALLVTGFAGILSGQGQTFTPAAVGVITAALLAWKDRLAGFSLGLTEPELRSAILLAIFAVVIYPALPAGAIDPWGLVEPRAAWVTVILIAGIGFANYLLLKIYGARGIELTGFLGGLVNSSVTVSELARRVRETQGHLTEAAYRGVLLATAAMVVRNAFLLAILATSVLTASAPALGLMLFASIGLTLFGHSRLAQETAAAAPALHLESPFSLQSALRFGLLFLVFQVAGAVAQATLGQVGFYVVVVSGALISSASAVASAATLAANGTITPEVAATGVILSSLSSALINLVLVARLARDRRLTRRLILAQVFVMVVGVIGIIGPSTGLRLG